jgi:hypothetical protein
VAPQILEVNLLHDIGMTQKLREEYILKKCGKDYQAGEKLDLDGKGAYRFHRTPWKSHPLAAFYLKLSEPGEAKKNGAHYRYLCLLCIDKDCGFTSTAILGASATGVLKSHMKANHKEAYGSDIVKKILLDMEAKEVEKKVNKSAIKEAPVKNTALTDFFHPSKAKTQVMTKDKALDLLLGYIAKTGVAW